MTVTCRLILVPGGDVLVYRGKPGDTYEDALLSFCINPDSVLILAKGTSIPQDEEISGEDVEIIDTGR